MFVIYIALSFVIHYLFLINVPGEACAFYQNERSYPKTIKKSVHKWYLIPT